MQFFNIIKVFYSIDVKNLDKAQYTTAVIWLSWAAECPKAQVGYGLSLRKSQSMGKMRHSPFATSLLFLWL